MKKEIGLQHHISINVPHSIVNTIWRTHLFGEGELLKFKFKFFLKVIVVLISIIKAKDVQLWFMFLDTFAKF